MKLDFIHLSNLLDIIDIGKPFSTNRVLCYQYGMSLLVCFF